MAESLHSSVLETLGREIAAGTQAPGSVLTLARLQARFGVSRTVARECMRLLEQLQMVTSSRRVGIVVRPSRDWDVLDPRVIRWRLAGPGRAAQLRSLAELRTAVEPLAAARAARYATDRERIEIGELANRLRAAGEFGSREDFIALDVEFHTMLLRSSRNEMFQAMTDVVAAVIGGRSHNGQVPRDPSRATLDAHDAVARAVVEGDARAAEREMREILVELRLAMSELDGL